VWNIEETWKRYGKDMEKTWKRYGKDMDKLILVYRFDWFILAEIANLCSISWTIWNQSRVTFGWVLLSKHLLSIRLTWFMTFMTLMNFHDLHDLHDFQSIYAHEVIRAYNRFLVVSSIASRRVNANFTVDSGFVYIK
jgi:hypothetical protein